MLGVWIQTIPSLALEDDNMHETKFSNLAQSGIIQGIEYYRIYIFKFQFYKLSLED